MAGIQRTELMYVNDATNVKIWKGTLNSNPIAIKETTFSVFNYANLSIKEAILMAKLRHPSICRVFDCFLDKTDSEYSVVVVMELMESDLYKEMTRRKEKNEYWRETELMDILKNVVIGLNVAKNKGIAHRDIKPQNLLLTGNRVKIGDFGCAMFDPMRENRVTVQGTPYFLSPELREKFVRVRMSEEDTATYDPFKSDVFSLGVTILCLGFLSAPPELGVHPLLQTTIPSLLLRLISYPRLQFYLSQMLQINPNERISLEELHENLSNDTTRLLTNTTLPTNSCCLCDFHGQIDGVRLPCGHFSHSLDCLFRYIRVKTEGFTLGKLPLCPLCNEPINQEFLYEVYGGMQYETLVAQEYLSKCCICHQREVQISYKKCSHLCCKQCEVTFFAMSVCPICSRLARWVSLGNRR